MQAKPIRRDELERVAATKNLRLVHRWRTKGDWVWDAVDTRTGMLAVRGVRRRELEAYLGLHDERGVS